jgi:hypothetical protein
MYFVSKAALQSPSHVLTPSHARKNASKFSRTCSTVYSDRRTCLGAIGVSMVVRIDRDSKARRINRRHLLWLAKH